jgi:hypothetical protein
MQLVKVQIIFNPHAKPAQFVGCSANTGCVRVVDPLPVLIQEAAELVL